MNHLFFIVYIFSIISVSYGVTKGNSSSIKFESNVNPFNFSDIKNLVVFGDSFTAIDKTNLDDMTYIEDSLLDDKWASVLSKKNNITLYNFAYGGAVIDRDIIPKAPFHSSFLIQYQQFYERMSKGGKFGDKWNGNDTLFAYWYGTNDNLYLDRNKYNNDDKIKNVIKTIIDTLFNKVIETYEMGGRNFLFIKAVFIEEFPYTKGKNRKALKKTTTYINNNLIENAQYLHNLHPDVNIFIYAADEEYKYIMKNFKDYKFNTNKDYYLKHEDEPLDNYIWIDGIHATPKTQEIISNNMQYLLETGDTSGMIRTMTFLMTKIIISISLIISIL